MPIIAEMYVRSKFIADASRNDYERPKIEAYYQKAK
jgi:hypothetical protein